MELDIYSPDKDGFEVKHRFEGWRVAYLRHAERFDNNTYLERHMLTDEIFMLLEGEATLLVGEKPEFVKMDKKLIYNVRKGEWHAIKVSRDALVLVIENNDTGKHNSEYMDYTIK